VWHHRTDLKSPTGSEPSFVLVHPRYDIGLVLNVRLVLMLREKAAVAQNET
jgi:hypothetical protein